ncbi:unnamed protein product [Adineta steineri]|uniref:Uncharacterized protein n=1 Tax=Adineta steineri TaxID=433720 RepID=A0A819LTS5_9BILA|nr:unnamed protein product [Adineta steineri]CAF3966873.1 unnamed protein product [Adineta steineri]
MNIGVAEHATTNFYYNLTLIGADFDQSTFGIVIPEQWVYKQDLDVNILLLRETGVLDDLRTIWFQAKTCSDTSGTPTTIDIDSLLDLFLIFGINNILAILLFLYKLRFMIKDYIISIFRKNASLTQKNLSIIRNSSITIQL